MNERVLDGITVLDLTASVSGPMCTALLGDAGARVIKLERIGGDLSGEWDRVVNGMSSVYVWNARNKESIALDLGDPEAREAAQEIAARADVIVENFSPGTAHRLGLGYEDVRARNPSVVYAHISGYGQTGPYRDEKAFDLLVQGESGLIKANGTPDEPCKVALSVADISSAMYAHAGILLALMHRARTGEGQEIDVSMLHSTVSWYGYMPYFWWYRKQLPPRTGAKHMLLAPYGPFDTSDGKTINVAVLTQRTWRTFAVEALELPAIADDARFVDNEARVKNRVALDRIVGEAIAARPQAYWLERLHALDIPCGRVRDLDEVLEHPQLMHDGAFVEAPSARGMVPAIRNPINMSRTPMRYESVPVSGEHTRAVLREFGLDDAAVDALVERKAAFDAPKSELAGKEVS
ncbi:MAG: CaiB/BaiF CoA-transferase family protein [Candidatus Velthaea sp.]